jgi:hypothetical protein
MSLLRRTLDELLTPFLLDPPIAVPPERERSFVIAGPFYIRTRQLVSQQIPLATCCGTAAD